MVIFKSRQITLFYFSDIIPKSFLSFQRTYLSSLGGRSVAKKFNNIFRKIGEPQLWTHFSLKGQLTGKTAVTSLRLHQAIVGKFNEY